MANLAEVLKELQQERDRLNRAIAALSPLAARNGHTSMNGARRPRRVISAAGRRRIVEAQRARWARVKGARPAKVGLPKRVLSAAARKRIADAQRARWAKVRQEKKAA